MGGERAPKDGHRQGHHVRPAQHQERGLAGRQVPVFPDSRRAGNTRLCWIAGYPDFDGLCQTFSCLIYPFLDIQFFCGYLFFSDSMFLMDI